MPPTPACKNLEKSNTRKLAADGHKIDLPPIQTVCTTMTPSNTSNSSDRAIIIFDWDDTILPSSFVDRVKADNLQELPQQYHNLFREIEQCTEKCLAAAAKHGEVS